MNETKLIFSQGVARKLIQNGKATLVDIKPYKENPERTIFVFKNDETFRDEFGKINDALKDKASNTPIE